MNNIIAGKQKLREQKEQIFRTENVINDALECSLRFSLLIEDYLKEIYSGVTGNFVVSSAGSFGRRELSPFSDIDVIFICRSENEIKDSLNTFLTRSWDLGIELSHTIRIFEDIDHFFEKDLHAFTPFLETRFICGDEAMYDEWISLVYNKLGGDNNTVLFDELVKDTALRHDKQGSSTKVIEPNVKLSLGGLRDFQLTEWIFSVRRCESLVQGENTTQAQNFKDYMIKDGTTSLNEIERFFSAYKFIITVRNLLHIFNNRKTDRLEFRDQIRIADSFGYGEDGYRLFMKHYFEAAAVIHRFARYVIARSQNYFHRVPDQLSIRLDDDFYLLNDIIYSNVKGILSIGKTLKAFHYRGLYDSFFDSALRNQIIESVDADFNDEYSNMGVVFRQILNLNRYVGKTLSIMNELGVLQKVLPEFAELNGYIQHGVYHFYSADEHTLKAIQNIEELSTQNTPLAKAFHHIPSAEVLYLAILFHDIAKPIDLQGHEILGAEIADAVMQSWGYTDHEIETVSFLVKSHLLMSQVAFHRDLNSAETLNTFVPKVATHERLNYLYLLTYADLSAVNPALWTTWKSELLNELYRKAYEMISDGLSGEQLLFNSVSLSPGDVAKHASGISEDHVIQHIQSFNDYSYISFFTDEDIARHIEEINSVEPISVIFKEAGNYTNITIITHDSESLLAHLCGVLLINDVNIHDAKIFTRKDGIAIDSFNVTDFKTGFHLEESKFQKIRDDFYLMNQGLIELPNEIKKLKTRWWRIENKLFRRREKVRVKFEESEKFTIIDVYSHDRLGLLYTITHKLTELGLSVYFAKILTNGNEIVDSFYVLDTEKNKIIPDYYDIISSELIESIEQLF
ncbi:MAG: HD domain-containing protein [Ignavibacteriaceae bacterium]|nr:HD domain-containing protein [Ignavibacteriaceae bacterium]